MAQPYVGEIRMFAGNFAPAGWMFCEGQLLPISENETLFQLIGTTYGGDGESTFALPDLRGRLPLHQGNGFILAETGGAEEITLTVEPDPGAHASAARAVGDAADSPSPRRQRARRIGREHAVHRGRAPTQHEPGADHAGRRQPAAHQLPALPVRRFHHLAVRDLPVADLRRSTMADPFVAEIRIFPFNFAPKGWAWCDGQLLPLSQNTALFSLLGTTYGGERQEQLRAARPAGPRADASRARARACRCTTSARPGGSETVTLLETEIPSHSHALRARTPTRPSAGRPPANRRARRDGRAEQLYRTATERCVDGTTTPWPPPAATSRTTTCSRT